MKTNTKTVLVGVLKNNSPTESRDSVGDKLAVAEWSGPVGRVLGCCHIGFLTWL